MRRDNGMAFHIKLKNSEARNFMGFVIDLFLDNFPAKPLT